ncbi:hypothetical protein ASPCAL04878 [Aspergillus calidoustus]|uniref:Altered inheritance of mitochondria protein 9, mitochondrial n=1 Tax=Aspergillus calidoustus TaxID=454130 RepID=A0A0U5GS90_ASPCI|nr:hypothetical protein ASPCAL04878 [Aspergillus calidoustus]
MNTLERYKIIDQVIQTEKELANIVLPAYGGLFLRELLPSTIRQHPLPQDLDPDCLFCVGPSCRRTWWHDDSTNVIGQRPANVGPWTRLQDYALSALQRQFDRIERSRAEVQRELSNFDETQSIDEYRILLDKLHKALPTLSQDQQVVNVSDPVLWHTDLHLGNIFFSPTDPAKIEGLIDWQSCHAAPLFLQSQFLDFLAPPKKLHFRHGITIIA